MWDSKVWGNLKNEVVFTSRGGSVVFFISSMFRINKGDSNFEKFDEYCMLKSDV
jgi:hypothetical protein